MMKKRVLAMLCMMFIALSLSGCNIKFVEKVEDSSKKTSSEEQFGDIRIDDSSSSNISSESESSEENSTKDSESENESESSKPIEEGTFVYADIKFISDDSKTTYWITEDCPAKVSPSMTAKDYTLLYRGDFVTLTALSEDNEWAMVSIYGGPSSFVKFKNLTLEEVQVSQTVKPIETQQPQESDVSDSSTENSSSSQETSSSESSSVESSTSQQPSESTVEPPQSSSEQVTTEPPQQSSTQPPVVEDTYGGIEFPSNASSTSFNMGVEFADVTITLTIRKDNAIISNGPDKPSNSTGYYAMGTLNKGDTIKCTGIGRNGYVRVEYGGNIGFIDSKYTEY